VRKLVQRPVRRALDELAHETAGGRWIVTGGGGYELVQVVPRTWTHLLAEAAGVPVEPATATPEAWRQYVANRTGRGAPERMTEGADTAFTPFESGHDPEDPVDRAISATRAAVFPEHGLLPH